MNSTSVICQIARMSTSSTVHRRISSSKKIRESSSASSHKYRGPPMIASRTITPLRKNKKEPPSDYHIEIGRKSWYSPLQLLVRD